MNKELFKYLNEFNLDENFFDKIDVFYNYLVEENEKYNLTSMKDDEEFICRHIYDSIKISSYMSFENKVVMDLGSGAGFPGIPLAILFPETKFYLVEATTKRANFLEKVKEMLKLENVTIVNKRVEELPRMYRSFFDIVLSRAVANLSILSEFSSPFLKIDGSLVAYKGKTYDEEIKQSFKAFKAMKLDKINIAKYTIPALNYDVYYVILTKVEECDEKYPRPYAKILKNPL